MVAVKWMLKLSSITAFVEGNVVHIQEGVFAIEQSCNGMHFFIVATAIAALFGEIHRDSWRLRARQVVFAIFLALLSNWVRVYVVIVAGHFTDMQHYLVRVSHYYFGWAVFAVCMALFFWVVSRSPLPAAARGASMSEVGKPRRQLVLGGVLALLASGIGPALGALAPAATPASSPALLPQVAGWQGPLRSAGSWAPRLPGSDREQLGEYRRDGLAVESYIAEYDDQRQGKELVGYGNSLLEGVGASVVSQITMQLGRDNAVLMELADRRGERSALIYFYEIGGQRRVTGLGAQLTYGMKSLGGAPRSRIVAARVSCGADCAAAIAGARQWLGDAGFAGELEESP